ncbi:MAG: DUF479 domain-containing protein [Deltaproteobacteria bacterium]|nr:DUF479 domain-containing protein [Deltaproteobacteria bacterium]
MNFVAHLFLAPCNDAFRVGSILADFTVGRMNELEQRFGTDIGLGIRHHREVDRYTDCHDVVMACVNEVQESFGIYASIVTDVVFDHFLLLNWRKYTAISKAVFFASIYQSLTLTHPAYPERYTAVVQRMLERRWLRTYEDLENVAFALMRVGERFQRKTPLANALPGLRAHYDAMESCFLRFFPQLQRFSDSVIAELSGVQKTANY